MMSANIKYNLINSYIYWFYSCIDESLLSYSALQIKKYSFGEVAPNFLCSGLQYVTNFTVNASPLQLRACQRLSIVCLWAGAQFLSEFYFLNHLDSQSLKA